MITSRPDEIENHMVLGNADRPDVTDYERHDVRVSMQLALSCRGELPKLVAECAEYIEDCSINDDRARGLFTLAINDSGEASRILDQVAEHYLNEFCDEHLADLQELFGIGPFAEVDEDIDLLPLPNLRPALLQEQAI